MPQGHTGLKALWIMTVFGSSSAVIIPRSYGVSVRHVKRNLR